MEPHTAPASSPPQDEDPLIGRLVGDVLIEERIASGGMGHVYRGQQQKPQRLVAVKFVRQGLGAQATRRFSREVELLGRLSHPHIAALFQAGEFSHASANLPYFVMEFVPQAEPLVASCRRRRLPAIDRLQLFLDACDAIAAGHARGIVHRDIKPGNILVSAGLPTAADGSTHQASRGGQVKVIDFGVATLLNDDTSIPGTTSASGRLRGTRPYMSPEQFAGEAAEVDARTDVYSLGVVLHELLTGSLPYDLDGRSLPELAQIVEQVPPRPLLVRDPSLSSRFRRGLQRVADGCLAKRPSDRYATAADLAADLRRLLAGKPLSSSPDHASAARRLGRPRRSRRWLAATIAVVLGMGAILIGSWQTFHTDREQPPPAVPPSERAGRSLLSSVGVSPDYPHASHASGADPALIPERIAPLEWVQLRFDPPLTARVLERSLTTNDLLLTRNGLPLATEAVSLWFDYGTVFTCRLGGLEPLTSSKGLYSLAIQEPAAPDNDGEVPGPAVPTPLYTWSMPDFSRFRFSLHDDSWNDHVVQMVGLEQHTESRGPRPATYLRPTTVEEEGSVVMRFPVDFPIHTAWLRTRYSVWTSVAKPFATRGDQFLREGNEQAPIDPTAWVTVEVANDGEHWIPVGGLGYGHAGVSFDPKDVSRLLAGSREAWVRARLFGSRAWQDEGIVFTQFLRTQHDDTEPAFILDLTGPPDTPAR